MRHSLQRLFEGYFAAIALFIVIGIAITSVALAAPTDCTTLPGVNVTQETNTSSSYAIWVLAKTETPDATPYIRVDSGKCHQLSLPQGTDWQWISGSNGLISEDIAQGTHTYAFSVNGGAVLMDKLLVTNNKACKPEGDGSNCIEKFTQFTVIGIEQDSTVKGDRKVSVLLDANSVPNANFEYFIDDVSVGEQNAAPYCLVDDPSSEECGLYNFSTLSLGRHTLRVVGKTSNGQTAEQTIGFTVGNTNTGADSISNTPLETTSDPNAVDNLTLSVKGIEASQVVDGKRSISAEVTGTTQPITVSYAINVVDVNSSTTAPYCMIAKNDGCGEWDSRSVINGNYNLIVRATAPGSKDKRITIPFEVKNSSDSLLTNQKQVIVVGNPSQQMFGTTSVTVPNSFLQNAQTGRKITYYMNDKEVASSFDNAPVVKVDTRKFTNGTYRLSAKITSNRGETTSFASIVTVNNDLFISASSWIRNNLPRTGVFGLITLAVLYFVIRTIMGRVAKRKFEAHHNIDNNYTYSYQYGKLSMHHHYMQVAASFALLMVGSFSILQLGKTQAAVGVGFTTDIANGTASTNFGGLSIVRDSHVGTTTGTTHTMTVARLNYSAETTQFAAAASTDIKTQIEGESMVLEVFKGRVESDTTANGGQALLIWSTAAAYKKQFVASANRLTIRAKAQVCNGGPIMAIKVDGIAVGTNTVNATNYTDYIVPITIASGEHTIEITFTNDYANTTCDRNLFIDSIVAETISAGETAPTAPSVPAPTQTVVSTFEGESMTLAPNAGRILDDTNASGSKALFNWGLSGAVATSNRTLAVGAGSGITIKARADVCSGSPIMELKLDGRVVSTTPVTSTTYMDYYFPVTVTAGSHVFEVSFTNDYNVNCDRNLYIDTVSVVSVQVPVAPTPPPLKVSTNEAELLTLTPGAGRTLLDKDASDGIALFNWGLSGAVATAGTSNYYGAGNAIGLRAKAQVCQGDPIIEVKLDGVVIGSQPINTITYKDYIYPVTVTAGLHKIEFGFTNDLYNATCDRNVFLDTYSILNVQGATPVPTPPPAPTPATSFTQNFSTGTNAASVNMTDIVAPGPHNKVGKIVIGNGRLNPDPAAVSDQDVFATANIALSNDQFAEADVIVGSTINGQYTGVIVRANIDGPVNYSWYKLETVSSSSQIRILALKDNLIAKEYYAPVPGGINPNSTYRLRLEAIGTTLRAYVNGNLLITQTDATLSSGEAGINIYGGQTFIDNLSVGNLTTTSPAPTPAPNPAPAPAATTTFFEAETMTLGDFLGQVQTEAGASGGQSLLIWSNATASKTVNTIAAKGIRVKARGDQCQGAPVMNIAIDGTNIIATQVSGTGYADYTAPLNLAAGSHKIDISFTNDFGATCDRNLYLDSITLTSTTQTSSPTVPTAPAPSPTPTPTNPTPSPTPTPAPGNTMGPYVNPALIPGPVQGASTQLLTYNTGYVPFSDPIGAFRTDCKVSHFGYNDPIVYPGQNGASHLHTFFGNTGVNAFTTQSSLENSGNSTCNGGILNRSGYWMPTIVNTRTGAPVMPTRVLVYYKTSYYGVSPGQSTIPPAGLRMIAGNSRATGPQATDPYGKGIANFACNSESFPFPSLSISNPTISNAFCPEGARQLFMEIRFPQCWNGRDLDNSFDHKSHMSYPTGFSCPASHPVGIPEIQLRVQYNYFDADRQFWKLSSDMYDGPGGYSSHADWWNGWDRGILNQIQANCWSVSRDCQVDNIGNGVRLGSF